MMPPPSDAPGAAGLRVRRRTDNSACTLIKENRAAPRVPASAVPSIAGVRLAPLGVDATLIDISAYGVAVECGHRVQPKSALTVVFDGTFDPASVEGRVARCAVAGIGKDGELQYEVGIAFARRIELLEAPTPMDGRPELPLAAPSAPPQTTAVRNRW